MHVNFSSTTGCAAYPGWQGCALGVGGADFNGDGITDLFWYQGFTGVGPGNGGVALSIWFGKGDGGFIVKFAAGFPSLDGYTPYFADFNGDGKTDILWDKIDSNGLSLGSRQLWISKGDGTFTTLTNIPGGLVGYRAFVADFNGDGLADILWVQESGGAPPGWATGVAVQNSTGGVATGAAVLWLGNGDGTFTVGNPITPPTPPTGSNYAPIIGDFNGDGKTDVLWDSRSGTSDTRSTGTHVLWLSDGLAPDLITTITDGIGASVAITYLPLTNSTVYTKDNTAIDPLLDVQGPLFVVSRTDSSRGIPGQIVTVSTTYAYAGAKADQSGRGLLGFRQMTVTDLQSNIVETISYRQDFPFTSLVYRDVKTLGSTTLNATYNNHWALPLGGTRYQVYLAQTQATSTDLDGSVMPTVITNYQRDAYSNPTQIAVMATDGFATYTYNTFTNDTANWFLGRLTNISVRSWIVSPFSADPPWAQVVVIQNSTNNLNLWNYLLSVGVATPGTPGSWDVIIASGVVIGSTSTTVAALDTGAFPSGSSLYLVNNGTIVGAGGTGGSVTQQYVCCDDTGNYYYQTTDNPGTGGGTAIRAQGVISISNNGSIWGGGGGGGSGPGGGVAGGGAGGGGAGRDRRARWHRRHFCKSRM
jgi:hypothetical protein